MMFMIFFITLHVILNQLTSHHLSKKINDYAFKSSKNLQTVSLSKDCKVETIGKFAFSGSNINCFPIPKSFTIIDDGAFFKCRDLESHYLSGISTICIPKHVKKICKKAFAKCNSICVILFEKESELETICEESFYYTGIMEIVIPKNVKCIEKSAFANCHCLYNVTFEDQSTLKAIKKEAFYRTGFTELKLPETVEELEPGWCRHTNKLNDVSFVSPNDFFKVTNNKIILGRSQSTKEFDVLYLAPRDIIEVVIPSYIKEIHQYAFSGCLELERVTFEEDSKLEIIGNESFSYSSVKKICIPNCYLLQ